MFLVALALFDPVAGGNKLKGFSFPLLHEQMTKSWVCASNMFGLYTKDDDELAKRGNSHISYFLSHKPTKAALIYFTNIS